jgi:tetratricopeptide (TPR) repeat protein
MGNLASVYSSLERHEDALALKERVLEHRRRVLPENHPAIGMAWYNLHTSYEKVGVYPRALECAKEALRIWQVSRPPGHEDILDAQKAIRKLST